MILLLTAVLLSGSLAAAQEDHIRNFQVVSQDSTNITFSWEIVDGYYTSSDINYFRLYFEHGNNLYTPSMQISYSDTTQNVNIFTYTSSVEAFYNYYYSEEFVMWIGTYRSSLDPIYTYSERLYVKFSVVSFETVFELKIHLQHSQTCSEFIGMSYSNSYFYGYISLPSIAIKELRRLLLQSCQCALPYHFTSSESPGYFTCTPSDYVVFRVRFSSPFESSVDPAVLKANLTRFITGNERNAIMNINGVEYFISPGPCGVIVPHLNSPHCFNDSSDLEAMPTQPVVSTSHQDKITSAIITTTATHNSMTAALTTMATAPTTMATAPTTMATAPTTMATAPTTMATAPTTMATAPTAMTASPTTTVAAPNPTGSAQAMVNIPDNTAIIAIIAAMCGTTLTLVLIGGIFVLILFMRMKKMAPKGTPQSQLHWHNSGPAEDSPWVLTHSRKSASISQKALTETNMSAVADEL